MICNKPSLKIENHKKRKDVRNAANQRARESSLIFTLRRQNQF